MTNSFWWKFRLAWISYIVVFSVGVSTFLTAIITAGIFFTSNTVTFDKEVYAVVKEIASFWFYITYAFAFLLAFIFSFKAMFNRKLFGHKLLYLDCERKDALNPVILLDVIPLWRKFLVWIVWILATLALVLLLWLHQSAEIFSGVNLFILIMFLGVLIIKPLLLSSVKVRIIKV